MSEAPVREGDVLAGKYRIERVLGIGGMGVVVAATHLQLDQKVALKFLLPDAMENKDVVARFAREARAAAKIQSEHVERVIDVGTLETGSPYMVMEYLQGRDLSDVLAERKVFPAEEAVGFVLQACEAIAEAHAASIVHRDLKPANLFLAERADKRSIVKVLDFGISKSSGKGEDASLTKTSSIMGSPLYMSPEQMVSSKHVDARCDVWALGIILYEFVTGSPPFVAETVTEIIAQILQLPAKPPHEVNGINPELSQAILRCIEKDPAKRYQNVGELAAALSPFAPKAQRNTAERVSRVLGTPIGAFPTMLASQPPQRPTAVAATNASWGAGGTTGNDTEVTQKPKGAGVKIAVVAVGLVAALAGASIVVLRRPAAPPVAAGLVAAPTDTSIMPSAIPSAPSASAIPSAPSAVAVPAAPSAPPSALANTSIATNTSHKSAHGSPPPKPVASVASSAAPPPTPAPAPTEKKNPLQIDLK
jgi:serine/threonine-protein kinase